MRNIMSADSVMKQSIEHNYRFLKGMYFDGCTAINGASIFFSDYIDDFFWNFAINIEASAIPIPEFILEVERKMRDLSRIPAFYITPWTEPLDILQANLRDQAYQSVFQDTWMFVEAAPGVPTAGERPGALTVKTARTDAEVEDFLKVYGKVYADEPTEEEPAGALPLMYIQALHRSFSARSVDTFHFIGYRGSQPVAISTLVYADGWGGIYNVGTLPEHRRQGFGSLISQACVDKWRELGGHTLFLQTEEGRRGEHLYGRLKFKTAFVAECWAK